ncbi:MAG: hypothetical protein EZS28_009328 [Streblomastix strix]|uniref:Reverse transcriptase domain-containing protein n=1 Tax=Streblomastix strix TaxID=222440 RepID=A0A5J4WJH6_9EUKA|nr:MAG: hypothetical protein EZS28_009328 [Streblomastix strix]
MEDLITVSQSIKHGDYATQLDLEKAYHHLKVSEVLQRYMGFMFRGKTYCYDGLPFGWNRSTLLFCRVKMSSVRAIRERFNVRVVQYMYDLLILSQERKQLEYDMAENVYDGSMHSSGQEKVFDIEVEKMVRDYDGEEGSRSQEASIAAGRVELSEIAGNGCISTQFEMTNNYIIYW